MRAAGLALAAAMLVAGCGAGGGGAKSTTSPAAAPGTLGATLGLPGPDVALIAGTSDYQPGSIRMSFDIVRSNGKPVYRSKARISVGQSLASRALVRATATLEPVGVPGESAAALGGITRIYVAHFRIARPGRYFVVAEPVGGAPIQGVGNLIVTA